MIPGNCLIRCTPRRIRPRHGYLTATREGIHGASDYVCANVRERERDRILFSENISHMKFLK